MPHTLYHVQGASFDYADLPSMPSLPPAGVAIEGDAHGNWRNILLNFQAQNMLVKKLSKDQHEKFNHLYHQNVSSINQLIKLLELQEEITQQTKEYEQRNKPNDELMELFKFQHDTAVKLNEIKLQILTEKNEFEQALSQFQFTSGVKYIFIGDVLSDRGRDSDHRTLELLQKIITDGVHLTILLSNHDQVFLNAWKKGLNHYPYQQELSYGQQISLNNLGVLIQTGLVDLEEIEQIIIKFYLPSLKLIDYIVNANYPNEITLLTHAPSSVFSYKEIAYYLGLDVRNFDADIRDMQNLKIWIDRINETYRQLLQNKNDKVFVRTEDLENYPLHKLIWSRWGENSYGGPQTDFVKTSFQPLPYQIYYIHGHDGQNVPLNKKDLILSVDNDFGKMGLNAGMSNEMLIHRYDGKNMEIRHQKRDVL